MGVAAEELLATAQEGLMRHLEHGPGRVEAAGGEGVEVWGDGLEAWAYLLAALCRFMVRKRASRRLPVPRL